MHASDCALHNAPALPVGQCDCQQRGLHKKAVYIVNRENNAAWSAMLKLAKNCKPGAIIPVTAEEFEAIRDGLVIVLPPPKESGE